MGATCAASNSQRIAPPWPLGVVELAIARVAIGVRTVASARARINASTPARRGTAPPPR
jgi:hypothetical protein